MKSVFFCAALLVVSFAASAQYVHKIKADSIKLTNDSCNAELILENSTKHIPGFLYNKGNGRTEFRPAVTRLPGGAYLIGGDTVRLGQDAILNQYAQKQTASAWVDSIKAKAFIADDSLNKRPVVIDGGALTKLSINQTFPFKGLNNSANNYNEGTPLVNINQFSDSSLNYSWNAPLRLLKHHRGSIGPSVWGTNTVYLGQAASFDHNFSLKKGTYSIIYNNGYLGTMSIGTLLKKTIAGIEDGVIVNNSSVAGSNTAATALFTAGGHTGSKFNGFYAAMNARLWFNDANNYLQNFANYVAETPVRTTTAIVDNHYAFYIGDQKTAGTYRAYGIYQLGATTYNYFAGQTLIGDTSVLNADVHKLYVSGSSKFAGNLVQSSGRTLLGGAIDDGNTPLQIGGDILSSGTINVKKSVAGTYLAANYTNTSTNIYAESKMIFSDEGGMRSQITQLRSTNPIGDYMVIDGWNTGLLISARKNRMRFDTNGSPKMWLMMNGNLLVGSNIVDDSTNIIQAAGSVKATSFISTSTVAPSSSADTSGQVGEIRIVNGYLYAKDAAGWKRIELSTF